MKSKVFFLVIAALGVIGTVKAQNNRDYQDRRDYQDNRDYQQNRQDYPRDRNYNNDDLYARCQGNPYGNYAFDDRNPFDTRSRYYDPQNPFDPRPVYIANRHGRWNEWDYRNTASPYDFCDNRRRWADRYYPVDPRNPYDIRNRYQSYGYNQPSRVIVVPAPAPPRVVYAPRGYGYYRHHRGW